MYSTLFLIQSGVDDITLFILVLFYSPFYLST